MITSHREVQEGLIRYIKMALDGYLSEMPTEIGSTPSVIKDRINAPRPDLPYIVVDKISSTRGVTGDNSWCKKQYLNEDEELCYEFERRVTFVITCYGEDSDAILAQLQYASMDVFNKNIMNTYTGASFTQFTDILEEPLLLGTEFVDGASTEVQFTLTQEFKPQGRGRGAIKGVEINGEYSNTEIETQINVTGLTDIVPSPVMPVQEVRKSNTKLRRPDNVSS